VTTDNVAVYVDPFSKHFEQDRLFDASGIPGGSDNALAAFVHLRDWLQARGVAVHTADLLDARPANARATNVYISLGLRDRYRRLARRPDVVCSGFFTFECPVVLPALYGSLHKLGGTFRRVFCFSSEEALRPFLRGPVRLSHFMLPAPFDDIHQDVWERRDRQFLVMINAHKQTRIRVNELYTERLRAIEFFNRYGEIDVYGRDFDGPPARMATRMPRVVSRLERRARMRWEAVRPPTDRLRIAAREAFRGPRAPRKADTLGRYTFSLCLENCVLESYIPEKIFDCFYAGTVPVYWGAPDIERWVPRECFVDMREFDDYGELRDFLHSRSPDQIEEYRVAAREFLRSEQFRPFSTRTFAELVGRLVEEDAGVTL
jgi:hypothetical protein